MLLSLSHCSFFFAVATEQSRTVPNPVVSSFSSWFKVGQSRLERNEALERSRASGQGHHGIPTPSPSLGTCQCKLAEGLLIAATLGIKTRKPHDCFTHGASAAGTTLCAWTRLLRVGAVRIILETSVSQHGICWSLEHDLCQGQSTQRA
jgi:hypothetical protein